MILFVGLSPAYQQIVQCNSVQLGEVNRAESAAHCAAGKVFNAARAASRLGGPVAVLAPLGGPLGVSMKNDLHAMGIEVAGIDFGGRSRICTTVVDGETVTELVEPTPEIAAEDLHMFAQVFKQVLPRCSHVVLMGSLPKSVAPSFFHALCVDAGVPIIADIAGAELRELLPLEPLMVKPNRTELSRLFGRAIETREDLIELMAKLKSAGPGCVLVTDGPNSVLAVVEDEWLEFYPPKIRCANPIGSGDALAGGVAVGLVQGRDLVASIQLGIAAAVANAQRLLPMDFTREEVEEIAGTVRIERFPKEMFATFLSGSSWSAESATGQYAVAVRK